MAQVGHLFGRSLLNMLNESESAVVSSDVQDKMALGGL
jgi:hypothetical protein